MPEVEVYFIDLPSYDFNSLFQMLPLSREGYIDADKNGVATRSYLAAVVCGSRFTRLYSQKSLHFHHYSVSLLRISESNDCEKGLVAVYLREFDGLHSVLKGLGRGYSYVDTKDQGISI
ncbi:hypothetical protein SUGI_0599200 [Cryptomeria japonica]|nr:hypothetical protein SUGI_0599200 [Cryptomeria japonica]